MFPVDPTPPALHGTAVVVFGYVVAVLAVTAALALAGVPGAVAFLGMVVSAALLGKPFLALLRRVSPDDAPSVD